MLADIPRSVSITGSDVQTLIEDLCPHMRHVRENMFLELSGHACRHNHSTGIMSVEKKKEN
jgi:hypothetical protein